MKKPLLFPLIASSLLVACATPAQNIQNKPTVIGEQDIQRMAQEGKERALNARDSYQPPVTAGVPLAVPPPTAQPKPPIVSGGKKPAKLQGITTSKPDASTICPNPKASTNGH